MSIVLGIDPGSRITGYGVIEILRNKPYYVGCGCIKTVPDDLFQNKMKQIYDGVVELIEQYHPEAFAIEKAFVSKSIDSAFKLCHARASAMMAGLNAGLFIGEYTPRMVKESVAGYGNAVKEQVQQMVVRLLKLNKTPQADAADALAIAICHSNTLQGLRGFNLGTATVIAGTSHQRIK